MNFARIINLKLERNIFWHVEIRENKGLKKKKMKKNKIIIINN